MTKQPNNPETEPIPTDVNQLMLMRQQKAAWLREQQHNPYGNDFLPSHTCGEILARFAEHSPPSEHGKEVKPLAEERFALAGRIVEHRSFGKAAFVKLADRSGRLQVYVRKDIVGEKCFELFKRAEVYDFLGVRGFVFFTKTGELTLLAEQATVLTKAIRPPPEKWSGLKDQETRYRQRYVDLVANPEVAEVFRRRTRIIKLLRTFFDERDFLEVETPLLHPILGGAAARPFRTHHNALDMPLYLRIAPELYLKRLVVGGFERVYELGRNFRNEGLDRQHNPEFTMLEFYMAYATYLELMDLTEELFLGLAREICGGASITYQGQTIDLRPPWPRITVAQAIINAVLAESASKQSIWLSPAPLPSGLQGAPPLTLERLSDEHAFSDWCQQAGLLSREDQLGEGLRQATSHGKRLGVLFDQLGEHHLPADRPVFVTDYPAAISPLSRRKDADPALVDRFELFIAGREMANAFSELNDPADQRARFVEQLQSRQQGDEEAMEYDEDYCRALEYGMPPAAGEGIGVDRLVMLLCDQSSIRDVIFFPHMRPEGK